jgi:hypothetical protein
MRIKWLLGLLAAVSLSGCNDGVGSGDVTPPAAPRGVYTVTRDHAVVVHWLPNTEADVAGYRVFEGPCGELDCPYYPVGATGGTTSIFRVTDLANGVTRFFAVAAFDHAGNESELSYETLFDTPRPEGTGVVLDNYLDTATRGGYDFSTFSVQPWDDPQADVYFGYNGTVFQMFAADSATDIQDYGHAASLDAVDYAPSAGWSPSGTVELIEGHCYVVWTRDDHYAKFRVTDVRPGGASAPDRVVFDWAYQVDPGNRELRAQHSRSGSGADRPITWIR